MSSIATNSGPIPIHPLHYSQGANVGGTHDQRSAEFEFGYRRKTDQYLDRDPEGMALFGLPPLASAMLNMNLATVGVDELPPLPRLARWGGTVQTEAVPAHRPSIVKQLSPSNILDNDRAEVVRQTKAEAWTENAKAVHCRHLQLINSVEQVLGRILALYSPGRFAQLVAQLGSDEERQVLVTLRGLRRASRNKGE